MGPVFKKLNLKAQQALFVYAPPLSFQAGLCDLKEHEVFCHSAEQPLTALLPLMQEGNESKPVDFLWPDFLLIFARNQTELNQAITCYPHRTTGDVLLWFAYPKRSSKRYNSDIHRDHSWHALGSLGFEPVRQIAIDEDWSALRFRRAEFIPKLKRIPEHALSVLGKVKSSGNK